MKKFGERTGQCNMADTFDKKTIQPNYDNITDCLNLIEKIAYNSTYNKTQKHKILNHLYSIIDFQITLLEENENE